MPVLRRILPAAAASLFFVNPAHADWTIGGYLEHVAAGMEVS